MKKNKLKKQTSETFRLSAILAISGGFQDAYTYNVRDEVFSNAQTGNVVLMSQNFMSGEWLRGLHYLFPIIAFALGVFVAERIQKKLKYVRKIHWRQIIVLMELAILFIVGLIPGQYNMTATMLVSFACSMQVQTFRKVNGYGYASTMCIGNLRSGMDSLCAYRKTRNKEILYKSSHYFGIIFLFAIGAGIGSLFIPKLGMHTIWLSSGLLLISFLLMFIKEEIEEHPELKLEEQTVKRDLEEIFRQK